MICFMKLQVEFMMEFVCLACISTTLGQNIKETVMDYIALGVIAQLDEIYYISLRTPLKSELEDMDLQLPISNYKDAKIVERKDGG